MTTNETIAKNSILLYIRMVFSMFVSLYTSRVVLNVLGVEDYGIYNVVGGIVAMLGFINTSMSGATSRFLTYSLGCGIIKNMRDTFSSALIIHICIAVVIFLIAETVGLWFMEAKLVIPENRMNAARVVYQISIFTAMLGITQVPYNSCIIAHEKMDVYAYVEILNVSLKLLAVLLLSIIGFDKLITYSILIFLVSAVIMIIYRLYCLKNFTECRFRYILDKNIIKPMLNFSGWDLYGNGSSMIRQQGVNIILNIFKGPVVNAANGIATSVNSVLMSFVGNITTAFSPQIIKNYASREFDKMSSLMTWALYICFTLFLALAIPLIFEMRFVLQLWLGKVPEYTVMFCRIIIMTSCFTTITRIINIGIHATGKIASISFISGTLIWMAVPVIYVLLKKGCHPNCAYYCNGIVSAIVTVVNTIILKHCLPQIAISPMLKKGIFNGLLIGMTILITSYCIHNAIINDWLRLIAITFASFIESALLFVLLLPTNERNRIVQMIKSKLK